MSETKAINVRVLFFASLREAMGVERLALSLKSGSADEVRRLLSDQLGRAAEALWEDNVRVACNKELLGASALAELALREGDELAFLPPVTGG